jgi:phage portal protein BeeE
LRRSGAGSTGSEFLQGLDLGATSCTNPFAQVAFVYRAVTAIAEQVATVPFRFAARAEGRDRITEGRLREFYERPHPELSGFQYWELRTMWLLLRGECVRIPVWENHRGKLRLDRILMLDPAQFRHQVRDGKRVSP